MSNYDEYETGKAIEYVNGSWGEGEYKYWLNTSLRFARRFGLESGLSRLAARMRRELGPRRDIKVTKVNWAEVAEEFQADMEEYLTKLEDDDA